MPDALSFMYPSSRLSTLRILLSASAVLSLAKVLAGTAQLRVGAGFRSVSNELGKSQLARMNALLSEPRAHDEICVYPR